MNELSATLGADHLWQHRWYPRRRAAAVAGRTLQRYPTMNPLRLFIPVRLTIGATTGIPPVRK